ncbi:DUF488 domain-containing protein [Kaarinaea lacus]
MQSTIKLYTIGHSDRSIDDFLMLLKQYGIGVLIDIRAYPHSTRFPHFSEETLRDYINNAGIEYHWAGRQLGGMRKPVKTDSHPALPSDSFRGFAEYMETSVFERAVLQLQNLATKSPTALMCAEKQAENCHRSLIADYLTLKNIMVEHIIDETTTVIHRLNELARIESAALIYDRNTSGSLFE